MTAAVAPVYQMWQSGSFWKKWGITKTPYDGWIPPRHWGQGGNSCQGEPHPQAVEKGTKPSLAGQHSPTCHSTAEGDRDASHFILCLTSSKESPSGQHSSKIKEFPGAARCQCVQYSGLNRSLSSMLPFDQCLHGLPVHWGRTCRAWAVHRAGVGIMWSICEAVRIGVFTELTVQHFCVRYSFDP